MEGREFFKIGDRVKVYCAKDREVYKVGTLAADYGPYVDVTVAGKVKLDIPYQDVRPYEEPQAIQEEDRKAHNFAQQEPIYKVVGFGRDEKGHLFDYVVGFYKREADAIEAAAKQPDAKVKLDCYLQKLSSIATLRILLGDDSKAHDLIYI